MFKPDTRQQDRCRSNLYRPDRKVTRNCPQDWCVFHACWRSLFLVHWTNKIFHLSMALQINWMIVSSHCVKNASFCGYRKSSCPFRCTSKLHFMYTNSLFLHHRSIVSCFWFIYNLNFPFPHYRTNLRSVTCLLIRSKVNVRDYSLPRDIDLGHTPHCRQEVSLV